MRLTPKTLALGLFLGGILFAGSIYMGSSVDMGNGLGAGGIKAGRQFAERNCARCHAIGQTGESPFEPAPPFRTFARQWPLHSIEEALAEGIVVGHAAMPEFELAPRQIRNLMSYLETIQR